MPHTASAKPRADVWPKPGVRPNVIASISGHTTLTEVARYTRAADQQRLARDGMAAIISRTGGGNGG